MGIIRSNAVFYLDARSRGVVFDRTLTLGRQRLYLHTDELRQLADRYRPDLRNGAADLRYGEPADEFLRRFLDVRDLEALDHSEYEGAALSHDLNQPIPPALEQSFDAVIDSGTLEHVFNFPAAIANCMNLVRLGGTLFVASPANNMCGHGFYQFSPELFFRLFSDANGFALRRLVLVTHPFPGAELSRHQTWYDVTDPAAAGTRAPLMTSRPAFLMMEAQRVRVVPILATAPQQSDYVARWQPTAASERPTGSRAMLKSVFARLPPSVKASVLGWYQRAFLCRLRNRRLFRRISGS